MAELCKDYQDDWFLNEYLAEQEENATNQGDNIRSGNQKPYNINGGQVQSWGNV